MFRFGDPGGRVYNTVGTSNANILAWWSSLPLNQGTISTVPGGGRKGGNCLRYTGSNSNACFAFQKNLNSQPTWGFASAFELNVFPQGGSYHQVCYALDAGSPQCDLRLLNDGSLQATRNGTVLGVTTAGLISLNVWNHVEFLLTISPTVGTVQVWVNGTSRLNLSGLNTRATSNSTANQVGFGDVNLVMSWTGTPTIDYDDLIIYDGQTTDANGLPDIIGPIGDCSLTWLLPTGAGTTTQFTPDSGVNYARVNEATPDGDTSYVSDATVGDIDTYAMADLPASVASVKSMAVCHYARKTDTNTRSISAEIRTNATNYSHATPIVLGTNYIYDFSNWGSNPNTSAAWTPTDINAIEVGQKVAS